MKRLIVMMAALLMGFGTTVSAESDYEWIEGGTSVDLGDIVSIDLDPEFVFLDAENTKQMSMDYGDPVSGYEIGSIFPMDESQTWAVFFDYEETGHIKDDEKEKIDAKALLKSYKDGAEDANKDRQSGERFYVTGWDIEPHYDEKTHNLTWSLLLEDDNKETFLNYNTRLLTREGNISVVLVTDPDNREADKKLLNEQILPKLEVTAGNKYEDFDKSTDKVSEHGLNALILGGAGLAVAKKVGILGVILVFAKKFGVLIVAGLAALWGFIRKKKKQPVSFEEEVVATEEDEEKDSLNK
ncbi:DUF2167 domain-containing protein [Sporosarcina jiandibaonis]|uniref:DUF2167 domain-containing protein n=1 Tax=Sporosarcina jiandibaonis TaxID=2715535 RepID=UPI0031B5D4AC